MSEASDLYWKTLAGSEEDGYKRLEYTERQNKKAAWTDFASMKPTIHTEKPQTLFPHRGATISVPIEVDRPASVCIHNLAKRPMCTIIPLEQKPDEDADGPWILSPWGNGDGIVCFIEKWDGQEFYDVEIIRVNARSVTGVPLEPDFEEIWD